MGKTARRSNLLPTPAGSAITAGLVRGEHDAAWDKLRAGSPEELVCQALRKCCLLDNAVGRSPSEVGYAG